MRYLNCATASLPAGGLFLFSQSLSDAIPSIPPSSRHAKTPTVYAASAARNCTRPTYDNLNRTWNGLASRRQRKADATVDRHLGNRSRGKNSTSSIWGSPLSRGRYAAASDAHRFGYFCKRDTDCVFLSFLFWNLCPDIYFSSDKLRSNKVLFFCKYFRPRHRVLLSATSISFSRVLFVAYRVFTHKWHNCITKTSKTRASGISFRSLVSISRRDDYKIIQDRT